MMVYAVVALNGRLVIGFNFLTGDPATPGIKDRPMESADPQSKN